jgi:polygalacturonase
MSYIRIAIIVVCMAAVMASNLSCRAPEGLEAGGVVGQVTGASLPVTLPNIPLRQFDVKKYGALGDGAADDTAAIQKAIDAAASADGGQVVLADGTYLSGPLTMRSRIDLHIEKGATLKTLSYAKYPIRKAQFPNFIEADGLHDIRISGSGTIDGQGQIWWQSYMSGMIIDRRPLLIHISRSKRIHVLDLNLRNSPKFHLVITGGSADATVDNLNITAPRMSPNTDGIDIKGSNMLVTKCWISTGDDNVAINGPSSKITVRNCDFGDGHGVSFGSYTQGGVSNVVVEDCTFDGTDNGLRGKSQRGRGGLVQFVRYSNLKMKDVRMPITFSSYYQEGSGAAQDDTAQAVDELTPIWKNIIFTNITSEGQSMAAGQLVGLPEAPIENFRFNNVHIAARGPMRIFHAKDIVFSDDSSIATPAEPVVLFDATGVTMPQEKKTDAATTGTR